MGCVVFCRPVKTLWDTQMLMNTDCIYLCLKPHIRTNACLCKYPLNTVAYGLVKVKNEKNMDM